MDLRTTAGGGASLLNSQFTPFEPAGSVNNVSFTFSRSLNPGDAPFSFFEGTSPIKLLLAFDALNTGDTVSTTGFSGSVTYNFSPVVAAVPLPGALPLFATGLGALGLLGWRRKRKA